MATAIARLLRADLRSQRMTTVLLGALVAAAALTLASTLGLRAQMDQPFERVVRQTNGGDLHAVTTRPGAPSLAPLTRLPGVAAGPGPQAFPDVSGPARAP